MARRPSGRVDRDFLRKIVGDKIARQEAGPSGSSDGEIGTTNDIIVTAPKAAVGFFGSIDKRLSGLDHLFGGLFKNDGESSSTSNSAAAYLAAKPGVDSQDIRNSYYLTNPTPSSPYSAAQRFNQHMAPLTDGTISGIASGIAMNARADVRQLVQGLGAAADGLILGGALKSGAGATVKLPISGRPDLISRLRRTDSLYWPPSDGALYSWPATLPVGYRVDRYGDVTGSFVSPAGTPIGMRSLDPTSRTKALQSYEVISPIAVQAGIAAPHFGQDGKGLQFKLPITVQDALSKNFKRTKP